MGDPAQDPDKSTPAVPDMAGCLALVFRVLKLAIADLENPPPPSPDEGDAARWMADDSEAPWSFRWCCEVLCLEPENVRRLVAAYG